MVRVWWPPGPRSRSERAAAEATTRGRGWRARRDRRPLDVHRVQTLSGVPGMCTLWTKQVVTCEEAPDLSEHQAVNGAPSPPNRFSVSASRCASECATPGRTRGLADDGSLRSAAPRRRSAVIVTFTCSARGSFQAENRSATVDTRGRWEVRRTPARHERSVFAGCRDDPRHHRKPADTAESMGDSPDQGAEATAVRLGEVSRGPSAYRGRSVDQAE
jgi:hypothetical protein